MAPGAMGSITYTVKRGQGIRGGCVGGASTTSCDDVGSIGLHFTAAEDPDTPRDSVGYRIEVINGSPPAFYFDLNRPRRGYAESPTSSEVSVGLNWLDDATDDQESLAFTIVLTPVDIDGHEGPTSAPVNIVHAGSGSGCAVSRAASLGGLPGLGLAIAAIALLERRRGRR